MQTWRPEDFITYMYHAVANADMVVDSKEIEVIQKSVKKLMNRYFNGVEYDFEKSLSIVKKTLENNPHLSKKEIINTLAHKFSFTKEMKIDIISDLTDITQADDMVLPVEHSMLAHIRLSLMEEPTKKEKLSA